MAPAGWSAVFLDVLVGILVAEGQALAAGVLGVVCQPLRGQFGAQFERRVLAEVGQDLVLFLGEMLAVLRPRLPYALPPAVRADWVLGGLGDPVTDLVVVADGVVRFVVGV